MRTPCYPNGLDQSIVVGASHRWHPHVFVFIEKITKMAQKQHIIDQRQRELRKRQYLAAPVLAAEFPKIKELVVHLRFTDPEGKLTPSPHKRIFVPEMQAYFDFECPLRDCVDGGFALSTAIPRVLSDRKIAPTGSSTCRGKRKRDGVESDCCGLELQYQITVHEKDKDKKAA
ncbi:MAG: hypothetical protein ACRETN_07705 [Nevskiales bacterium]